MKSTYSNIRLSYNSCNPEWFSFQDFHLVLELENAFRSFTVMLVMIKGIVKIMPRGDVP